MKREDAAAGGAAAKRERGSHLKEVGEKWKAMSDEAKQVYVERAAKLKSDIDAGNSKPAADGDEILEAADDSSSDDDSSDSEPAPAPVKAKKKKKDKSGH